MTSGRSGRRRLLGALAATLAGAALGAGCAPAARPAPRGEPARLRVELPSEEPDAVRSFLAGAVREHAQIRGYEADVAFRPVDELPLRYPPGSGQLPDVALAPTLGPARLFWDVSLRDVTESAERAIRRNGEVVAGLRAALTFDQRLWAAPYYSRAWGWLVRQDLLDARGVAAPSTFAEAAQAARRLADPGRGLAGWSLPLLHTPEGDALVHQVIVGYGGALADAGGRRPTLESPETIAAVGFLAGLLHNPELRAALPTSVGAWAAPEREAEFQAGRIALAPVSGSFAARLLRSGALPRRALASLPPPAGPKRRATSAEGCHLVVAAASRRPDLCLDLLEHLLAPARLRGLMLAGDGAVVPAYADLSADPFWDADPIRQAFALNTRGDPAQPLLLAEYGYPGPGTPAAGEVGAQLVLGELLARVAEEGLPPEEAVREAQRRAQGIYEGVGRAVAAARRRVQRAGDR